MPTARSAHRRCILMLSILGIALQGWSSAHARQTLAGAESLYQETTEVTWRSPVFATTTVDVHLLGINDFHGRLFPPPTPANAQARVSGGADVLAAYIAAARREHPKQTLTLIAGDSIGATQMVSALLNDEPTLSVLDALADGDCPRLSRDTATTHLLMTHCRTLATVGNHEFDHGAEALERQLYGNLKDAEHPGHWPGIHVPFLAANVLRRTQNTPFLPPAAIVELEGAKVGVIGAVTRDTPLLVTPSGIAELRIDTEAPAINAAVDTLHAAGVHTIVLVIHEGLESPNTVQTAPRGRDELRGGLARILADIHGVDVIIAGHTHQLNAVLAPIGDGSLTLIMQARSYGTALSQVDLTIDTVTGRVIAKSGRIVDTYRDRGPGREPLKAVTKIITHADQATRAARSMIVNEAPSAMSRGAPTDPEAALGDLVADAQRQAVGADIAFVNAGGIRSDLPKGPITVATLYDIEPFGNHIMTLDLTGEQILRVLEEQWPEGQSVGHFLRVSGLHYQYDPAASPGHHVLAATTDDGRPLERGRHYSVAANDFIVGGGDHYTVFSESLDMTAGPIDIEALQSYLQHLGAITPPRQDRVTAAHATDR